MSHADGRAVVGTFAGGEAAGRGAGFTRDEIALGVRLLWRLGSYLRRPVDVSEARAILRARIEHRETDFLALVRRAVYDEPGSPYRALLRLAGCEYGDLDRLVHLEGVEGALRTLYRQGVYLTVDEFKGRRPAVRGGSRVDVNPGRLRNPMMEFHLLGQSSGSRGKRTSVPMDLTCIRDRAVNALLTLQVPEGVDWRKAVWADPGGCLALTIRFSSFGRRSDRSFCLIDPAAPGLHPSYRWSSRAVRWASMLGGTPLPPTQHVPLEDPLPIVRWIESVRRGGSAAHVWTYVSAAVRLCRAAESAGLELQGARFTVTGEPLTAARLAAMLRARVEVLPDYGSAESGFIAYGCFSPIAPDDVHLFHDLHALIQIEPAAAVAGVPGGALLVSSLRASAPVVLLNVSMGDRAEVVPRRCGCPLDGLGWRTHLHTIRSFEKLTTGGMTFLDGDVVRVLEEVLPARFGGAPTDYQIVEEETESGQPRLRLLVHPSVGTVDATAVARAFLAAIGADSRADRMMAMHWEQAAILAVERCPPRSTASGKILHLYRAS